jgi:ParB family transcriptional regulator, chromosome partitioning protein
MVDTHRKGWQTMTNIADDNYIHGKIYQIKCTGLQPNGNQSRKFFCPDSLEKLEESIICYGQIHPITFTRIGGILKIVSGERRWLAFQKAGIEYIQAKYVDRDIEAIALAENFQREDLLPMEKAELILTLKKQHCLTLAQIANYIGKSVPSVSELISLNRLPEDVKVACRNSNSYVLTRLVKIAKASGQKSKKQLFKAYQHELSGEKYRGELRRNHQKAGDQFAILKGAIAYLLAAKINGMAKYDSCDYMLLVDEMRQLTRKISNEYNVLDVSIYRRNEAMILENTN